MRKQIYVQVGLGGRHELFRDALLQTFAQRCELAAVCDSNPGRLSLCLDRCFQKSRKRPKGYLSHEYIKMLRDIQPDYVVVTSIDCTHDEYICQALQMGCNVITEKPMTIDADRCRRILQMQQKSGKAVKVAFNYRYSPARTQIKDLLLKNLIGDVLSIDFHWMLDTTHGADYFRRWHRKKKNSGGLLVHKATHHFDLVNWWIDSVPESVFASGHRHYYTPETARALGLKRAGDRCLNCADSAACPFYLDLEQNVNLKAMYLECEKYDGYYRDRCVFDSDIDIEDCMNMIVNYRNGVKLSYSLNAFMPWEGYTICFNGSKGRLEHKLRETVYVNADGRIPAQAKTDGSWIWFYPHFDAEREIEVWPAKGGHGGGDELLLKDLFLPESEQDFYGRSADHIAGAWSILTGIAANISIKENRNVKLEECSPIEFLD